MKISKVLIFFLLLAQEAYSKEKFKYKVVKPKKKCVITYESTFSVTGFLTFTVVAVTAVANVIGMFQNSLSHSKCRQKSVKMQSNCSPKIIRIHSKQSKCCQKAVKMQPKCSQNAVKIQSALVVLID